MKTTNIIVLIAIAALVIGGIIIMSRPTTTSAPTEPGVTVDETTPNEEVDTTTPAEEVTTETTTTTTTTDTTPASSGYTMAEVATHNSASSCWSVVDGNVYDLTSWITKHPGGEKAILSLCGIDGSAAFNGQHGMNAQAKSALTNFKLGALAN